MGKRGRTGVDLYKDNFTYVVFIVLGATILFFIWWLLVPLFLGYYAISQFAFWYLICTRCANYGSGHCPSGQSIAAARYFKKRKTKEFRKAFKKYIGVVFPWWFIPLIGAVYLFLFDFSMVMLIFFIGFCIIGFIFIPFYSKGKGCKDCKNKKNCPWV
jgi:hypothetical protein